MIAKSLAGHFDVYNTRFLHGNTFQVVDFSTIVGKNKCVLSSVTDEVVFPFYYVVEFAKQLRDIFNSSLNDKTISKLAYKIMQFGYSKDGKDNIEQFFSGLHIKEEGKESAQEIAKYYLEIRDKYIEAQQECHEKQNWKEFKEKTTDIFDRHKLLYNKQKPESSIAKPKAEIVQVELSLVPL